MYQCIYICTYIYLSLSLSLSLCMYIEKSICTFLCIYIYMRQRSCNIDRPFAVLSVLTLPVKDLNHRKLQNLLGTARDLSIATAPVARM